MERLLDTNAIFPYNVILEAGSAVAALRHFLDIFARQVQKRARRVSKE
jgi:hypothetical protein